MGLRARRGFVNHPSQSEYQSRNNFPVKRKENIFQVRLLDVEVLKGDMVTCETLKDFWER